jgi:hypothetical protein
MWAWRYDGFPALCGLVGSGLFDDAPLSSWVPEGSEGSEGITKVLVISVAFAFWSGGGPCFAFMPGVASVDRYTFVAHRLVSVPCLR